MAGRAGGVGRASRPDPRSRTSRPRSVVARQRRRRRAPTSFHPASAGPRRRARAVGPSAPPGVDAPEQFGSLAAHAPRAASGAAAHARHGRGREDGADLALVPDRAIPRRSSGRSRGMGLGRSRPRAAPWTPWPPSSGSRPIRKGHRLPPAPPRAHAEGPWSRGRRPRTGSRLRRRSRAAFAHPVADRARRGPGRAGHRPGGMRPERVGPAANPRGRGPADGRRRDRPHHHRAEEAGDRASGQGGGSPALVHPRACETPPPSVDDAPRWGVAKR